MAQSCVDKAEGHTTLFREGPRGEATSPGPMRWGTEVARASLIFYDQREKDEMFTLAFACVGKMEQSMSVTD